MQPGQMGREHYIRCLTETIAEYARAGYLTHVASEHRGDELKIELRLSQPDRFHSLFAERLHQAGLTAEPHPG